MWIMMMYMLDQDFLDEVNNFLYILSTTLSFFIYFMTQWLEGNMSTDLIVRPDPFTVAGFQELLDAPDVHIMSMKNYPDFEEFEFYEEDTLERKLWDKAVRVSKETGIPFLHDPHKNADPAMLQKVREMTIEGKTCSILRGILAKLLVHTAYKTMQDMAEDELFKDFRSILYEEKNARRFKLSYVFAPGVPKKDFEKMFRAGRLYAEAGLGEEIWHKALQDLGADRPSIYRRISDHVQEPDEGIDYDERSDVKIRIVNVQYTMCVLLGGYTLALTALICESSVRYWHWHRSHKWFRIAQKVLKKSREERKREHRESVRRQQKEVKQQQKEAARDAGDGKLSRVTSLKRVFSRRSRKVVTDNNLQVNPSTGRRESEMTPHEVSIAIKVTRDRRGALPIIIFTQH